MVHAQISKWTTALACLLAAFGIARAANSHYADQRTAFFASQEAERKRQGLADWKQIKAMYPTPEITLCRAARVVPGASADVTVRGKFVPGSKFLFENDDVQVVKENATPTEYHATIRVPSGIGPGYSPLHVFSAVSGIEAGAPCRAVYIGGKYEWNFTAQNGWRIKLSPKGEVFPKDGSASEVSYTADFYRGNDTQPFAQRVLSLGLGGTLYGNSYSGGFEQPASSQEGAMADMQQILQKAYDPKTSPEERARLMQRVGEMGEKMSDPNLVQKQQKEAQFACGNINFTANEDPVEGQLSCQQEGTIKFRGTRRFVGP